MQNSNAFLKLLVLLLVSPLVALADDNKPPDSFLKDCNPFWTHWLKEKVSIDVKSADVSLLVRKKLSKKPIGIVVKGDASKPVTISAKNVSRREILWRIHKATGYKFFFHKEYNKLGIEVPKT